MSATDVPQHQRRPHPDPWLVAVVVLAAAFIGLASWVVVDRSAGDGGAPDGATAVIDRENAAWSAGDASTVSSLFAKDAVARLMGHPFVGSQAIANHAAVASRFGGFRIARTSPVSVSGDFAVTLAEYGYGDISGLGELLSVYQFRDGKILREWRFKLGATEPFADPATP